MSFDNVRRMAERGLMRAQQPPAQSAFIDMFQHILDEYEREAKVIHNNAIEEAAIAGGHSCESCRIPDGQKVADKIRELKV